MSQAKAPKTPSRQRTALRPPLTPSLVAGLNAMRLSPRKGDQNPFASSPVKRGVMRGDMAELKRQASQGVLRRGGIETKFDVITNDYVPPPKEPQRSKSSTSLRNRGSVRDRFVPDCDDRALNATLEMFRAHASSSPGHAARLASAAGVPYNRRILGFHEAPPAPPKDNTMAAQREAVRPLYARAETVATSTGVSTNKTRRIATTPERVLDAPGMVDDYYLNLLSFSSRNIVGVALGDTTYMWKADSGEVVQVGAASDGSYVSAVDWSNDGSFLGVGVGTGDVELWDATTQTRLRTMAGHQGQVAVLSWHNHLLSSGCGDGSIWHHDVRVARHKVMELLGHTGEVCGLKWRADGEFLASGGNDNAVNLWDGRLGDVGPDARGAPKWTKRNHKAAVKAIAWSPWDLSLLASGGGTSDATVHLWSATTGARLQSVQTPSQVTSVVFAPARKEFLTTHGYPTNAIMVHGYPSMAKVAEIRDAHDARVLFSALSPAGDIVCTGAGDENLKFWRIWDIPPKKKKQLKHNAVTADSILTLR